jgi:polyhydroxyalkanoate synthesis regulator phasin
MADLQAKFREAWSQALVGLNAAEAEAEKVLGRLADAAGLTPEDVKHHAREFGERLSQQRRELERAIDDGVRRAVAQFRVPTRDEIETLRRRIDEVADRLEAVAQERARKP